MKINKIFVAVMATIGLTSCNDWLDMEAYKSDDTEFAFQNETNADLFVQGCYRGIVPGDFYYQMGMGDGVMHSCEDATTNNSKYNICNYKYDATTPTTLTGVYNEEYGAIEQANIAIKNLSEMAESNKRNSMLGEALCLRAFGYLNLIRVYGDVPARWLPMDDISDKNEALYPKRTSRDEIYDKIIADLQQAVDYLPWFSESGYATTERFTKQAAYALLARTALYAGGYSLRWNLETNDVNTMQVKRCDDAERVKELYQIADNACKAVINKGENYLVKAANGKSGYENLWYNFDQRNLTAVNSEMLLSLAQYGSETNSKFQIYAHPGSRGGTFGSRKAMQFILPTYYLSFDKKDTRRDVNCTSYSIYFLNKGNSSDTWVDVGTTYSCIMSGKFRLSWCVEPQDASKRNLNIPILRYADVLLMYAEAENFLNNGPTSEAKNALKEVRERAGIADMEIPSTQTAFDDALAQERKWEFATEFMLRTDLIRMGRLAKEIAQTKLEMKDLSDKRGAYANVATYRLYKFHKDAQVYGDEFLAVDYIDITDAHEIEILKTVPNQAKLAEIVQAHGIAVNNGDKWYPVNMFEAYNSSFNVKARQSVGFSGGAKALQIGNIIYTKPTGKSENGGTYPNWIEAADGSDGLYYGYVENHCELLPFANKSAGHPMVDNPNLTQLPGYEQ